MKKFAFVLLASIFVSGGLLAGTPSSTQWLRLLGLYDANKDKQLSVRELGSGWYVFGKYDFNRNGQLTQKEFDEKRIPPAIKK